MEFKWKVDINWKWGERLGVWRYRFGSYFRRWGLILKRDWEIGIILGNVYVWGIGSKRKIYEGNWEEIIKKLEVVKN